MSHPAPPPGTSILPLRGRPEPPARRRGSARRRTGLLPQRLEVQERGQHAAQDAELPVQIRTVLGAAVIPVLVAAPESLTEVVVVLALVHVHARVAVVRIFVGVRIPVIRAIAVLPIRLSGAVAFLVAVVHGLLEQIGAVLVDVIAAAQIGVPIARGGVEVGIVAVVVGPRAGQTRLLLPQARQVILLEPLDGLSWLLCGLGVLPLLVRLSLLVGLGLGARLLSVPWCLLLFLVLLLSGLRPAFRPLLLCLSMLLLLLLLVLLLAFLLLAFLFALSFVLLVGRPNHHGSSGQGERTDDKDRALESLQTHASPP